MLDIKFVRENPDTVKENIKKKFQDEKLPLVDEVVDLDVKYRAAMTEANELRASRNALSKKVGQLMGQAKKDPSKLAEAEEAKAQVKANADRLAELETLRRRACRAHPQDHADHPEHHRPLRSHRPGRFSANVEVERFGEPAVPDFDIPYHTEIMESFNGVDMDSAGRVSGSGFYYLMGDIARLHSAVMAYAPRLHDRQGLYLLHTAVHDPRQRRRGRHELQTDMDAMMYKIEGEDLYLIGTSEHSMIGKFIDQILPEDEPAADPHELLPLLPQGKGRARHRRARRLPHPPV